MDGTWEWQSGDCYALSVEPNRMATVSAMGSPSETSAATDHTQERSEPMLGLRRMSAVILWLAQTAHVVAPNKARKKERGVEDQHLCQSKCTSYGSMRSKVTVPLSVLSRRIRTRVLPVELFLSSLTSPVIPDQTVIRRRQPAMPSSTRSVAS